MGDCSLKVDCEGRVCMKLSGFDMEKLVKFLDDYPGTLFLKDDQGCYTYASQQCEHINPGLIGKNELSVQKDPALGREYYEQDMKLLREGGDIKCFSEFKIPGTNNCWFEINKSAVEIDGKIVGIIGTVVDVTHEFQLSAQINRMLVTDPTTGVYNRTYLKNWREKADETIVYPFTIIACDCNFLKRINDTFGHESGDELLKKTGNLFLQNLPEKCTAVRTGGDEFLILCNETTAEEAQGLIDLLTEKAAGITIGDVPLSIAYGCSTIQHAGEKTPEACKKEADQKMYAMKRTMKAEYYKEQGKFDPIFNENFLRSLINEMPVLVFFKDTECRYRYMSAYHEAHLKDKHETNFGIGCTDLELQRDPELGRKYYEDDLKILRTGKGSIMKVAMPGDDGKTHYYRITKSAHRDETRKIIGILGNVMDVTATGLDFTNIPDEYIAK